jgi:hypothetical protein
MWLPQPPGVPSGVPPKNLPAIAPLGKFKTPNAEGSGSDVAQPLFMPAPGTDFDQLSAALSRGLEVAGDTLAASASAAPSSATMGDESEEVERLRAEVARWQTVNNALMQRLGEGEGGSPAAKSARH